MLHHWNGMKIYKPISNTSQESIWAPSSTVTPSFSTDPCTLFDPRNPPSNALVGINFLCTLAPSRHRCHCCTDTTFTPPYGSGTS